MKYYSFFKDLNSLASHCANPPTGMRSFSIEHKKYDKIKILFKINDFSRFLVAFLRCELTHNACFVASLLIHSNLLHPFARLPNIWSILIKVIEVYVF